MGSMPMRKGKTLVLGRAPRRAKLTAEVPVVKSDPRRVLRARASGHFFPPGLLQHASRAAARVQVRPSSPCA